VSLSRLNICSRSFFFFYIISLKSDNFGTLFFHKIPVYESHWILFIFGWKFAQKKGEPYTLDSGHLRECTTHAIQLDDVFFIGKEM
jgi:hypothetical protein